MVDIDPKTSEEVEFTPSSNTSRIALQILGFYILATSIPVFVQILTNSVAYHSNLLSVPEYLRQKQEFLINLVGPGIKIIIGAWFIFGAKAIIGFVGKFDNTIQQMAASNHANSADAKKPRG